jgi:hypothetical protein
MMVHAKPVHRGTENAEGILPRSIGPAAEVARPQAGEELDPNSLRDYLGRKRMLCLFDSNVLASAGLEGNRLTSYASRLYRF